MSQISRLVVPSTHDKLIRSYCVIADQPAAVTCTASQSFTTVYSSAIIQCLRFFHVCHCFILILALEATWSSGQMPLSLPMWHGSNSLFLSDLLLLVHCSVNVDIRMEAGLSVSPAFLLSCDCLEATKGRLRQEEMASTLLTCHLRCVSYGHVALKACPSQREPHNENA